MDETATGLLRTIGDVVQDVVRDVVRDEIVGHEDRFHIPPPRKGRVQAIPFANVTVSDVQTSRAVEMLTTGSSLEEASLAVGVPIPALERALAEYRPAWRKFLHERETAG